MKKNLKIIGVIILCISSFYYTDKVSLYVKKQNPIYKDLENNKEKYNEDKIEAKIIDDKYIIPGLNGKKLNVDKSFRIMHSYNEILEEKLVFDEIEIDNNINKNKDKIIIRGNEKKNMVSLIFEKENDLTKYMIQNNYKIDLLIEREESNINCELINNSYSNKTYKEIEIYLNKNKINKNLCYVKDTESPLCKNKFLFKESLVINHSNISTTKNKINSGDIILIKDNLSIEELKIIINQIDFRDLKIVYLSELINESYH